MRFYTMGHRGNGRRVGLRRAARHRPRTAAAARKAPTTAQNGGADRARPGHDGPGPGNDGPGHDDGPRQDDGAAVWSGLTAWATGPAGATVSAGWGMGPGMMAPPGAGYAPHRSGNDGPRHAGHRSAGRAWGGPPGMVYGRVGPSVTPGMAPGMAAPAMAGPGYGMGPGPGGGGPGGGGPGGGGPGGVARITTDLSARSADEAPRAEAECSVALDKTATEPCRRELRAAGPMDQARKPQGVHSAAQREPVRPRSTL